MKRLALILLLALTAGYIGCSEDSTDPVGPMINSPSGLTATAISDSEIGLSWTNRSPGVSSSVQRTSGSNGNWATIADVGADVQSHDDSGLNEGSTYRYRIISNLEGSQSSPSLEASAITLPSAPENLEITSVNGTTINLVWDDVSAKEAGYDIQRRAGGDNNYSSLEILPADAVNYEDAGLADNIVYYYKIAAKLDDQYSTWSNEATASTFAGPTGLEAAGTSDSEIQISWHDNSLTEDGFHLERSPAGTGNWSLLLTVDPGQVSHLETGLNEGISFDYRIRAFTEFGISDWSNTGTATTWPAVPSTFSAENDQDAILQVNLTWQDNSGSETGYELERRIGDRGLFEQIATLEQNSSSYEDSDVVTATTYYYRLRAAIDAIISEWSDLASVTTNTVTPNAPGNLTGDSPYSSLIVLSWTDNSDNEDGFVIERSLIEGGAWVRIGDAGGNETSFDDNNVEVLTTYYYRINAFNEYGNSDYSNTLRITTGAPPPYPPSGLTATDLSHNLIRVQWNQLGDEPDGMKLERSLRADSGWVELFNITDLSVVSYIDRTVVQQTTYYYRAFTYNDNGTSFPSQVAEATTPQAPPLAPNNFTAEAPNYYTVILNWSDNSDNELGFDIERYNPQTREWDPLTLAGADVTTYMDADVIQNTYYRYGINAYNDGGISAWIETDVTTPDGPPAAPYELRAEATDYGELTVRWMPGSYNEDGFILERMGPDDFEFGIHAQIDHQIYTHVDLGLPPETYYTYRVYAFNNTGISDYSDSSGAATRSLVMIDDGFEDYDADADPPNPWSVQEDGNASVEVTDAEAHDGGQSLHLNDPDDSSIAWAWVNHNGISDAGYFSSWLKISTSGDFLFCGTNPGTFFNWQLNFDYNDTVRTIFARDGGGLTDVDWSWPVDQWFHVEVDFDFGTGNYDVTIDDELVVDGFGMQPGVNSASRIYMLTSHVPLNQAGGVEDIWADDFYLEIILPDERQAAPPPSAPLGGDRIDHNAPMTNFDR